MTMEARVGVVVEGGQRALNSATASAVHNSVVDAGNRKLLHQPPQTQTQSCHQQHQSNKQSLNQKHGGSIEHLAAGGISGAFSKTCTAPLARLTILFQVCRIKFLYGSMWNFRNLRHFQFCCFVWLWRRYLEFKKTNKRKKAIGFLKNLTFEMVAENWLFLEKV